MGAALIQLVPQGLGLPGVHLGLELGVEVPVVQRVEVQEAGEDVEGLEGPFACGSLHKVLEDLAGLRLLLVFILSHGSGAVWSTGVEGSAGVSIKRWVTVTPAKEAVDR